MSTTPSYQDAVRRLMADLTAGTIGLEPFYLHLQSLHAQSTDPAAARWAEETAREAADWQNTVDGRAAGVDPYPHIGRAALRERT